MKGELPKDWNAKAEEFIKAVDAKAETIASRKASQNTLNGYGPVLPEFLGGSADLAGSNLTIWKGSKGVSNTVSDGNYIYYGVREFGMSAIMNGIALHGGFIPYGATFLMFSEYARNALRMAALMKIRSIFVYTHDSIGLGEDGPTHQPVEQTATLRLIPNMSVWRPCDAVESAVCWKVAIERRTGPSMPDLLAPEPDAPEARRRAARRHPPWRLRAVRSRRRQARRRSSSPPAPKSAWPWRRRSCSPPRARRCAWCRCRRPTRSTPRMRPTARAVLPKGVKRVAVEAGVTDGWYKYVGLDGKVVGLDRFGESAPAGALFKEFGFTGENVVEGGGRDSVINLARPCGGSSEFSNLTFWRFGHGNQSRYQRFRPHRPYGVPRGREGLQGHRDRRASTTCSNPDYLAYMLKYDSVHGRFNGDIKVEGNNLIVNGKKIRLTAEKDPANLKWSEVGADIVIECTGFFLTKETCQKHINAGAKKVVQSRPVQGRHPDVRVRREPQDHTPVRPSSPPPPAPPTAWPRSPRCCTTTSASSAA